MARVALTPREIEILRHMARGLTTAGIARQLGKSEGTVKGQKRMIYLKLGVRNAAQAMTAALREGYLP